MSALEDLVVDTREVDHELLASMLAPFLRIERESGRIVPQEAWNAIPSEMRVLLFLMARKAMIALDFPIQREAATVTEIQRGTEIASSTVRTVVKRLVRLRTVTRGGEGCYLVPNYALPRIRGMLKDWLEASTS